MTHSIRAAAIAAGAVAAAIVSSGVASAQAIDLNLGYTRFDDSETDAITGRIGGRFLTNFGVEGEGSFSVNDDDGLDSAWGVFAKGILPLSGAELFARVGFANAEGGGGDDDGVAYGGGGQFNFGSRSGVRADYTRYDFGNDEDAFSISYVFRLN